MPPVRSESTPGTFKSTRFDPFKRPAKVVKTAVITHFSNLLSGIKTLCSKSSLLSVEEEDKYVIHLQQQAPKWPIIPGSYPDLATRYHLQRKYFNKWRAKVEEIKNSNKLILEFQKKRKKRLVRKHFLQWLEAAEKKRRQKRIKRMRYIKFSANEENLSPWGVLRRADKLRFRNAESLNFRFSDEPDQVFLYRQTPDNELKYIEVVGEGKGEDEREEETELEKYINKYDKKTENEMQKLAKWWEWKYKEFAKTRGIHRAAMNQYRTNWSPHDLTYKRLI
ncbi:hypothetical protein G9A89_013033 [Geosiphon pyriformis]|nr:hypothetical protein G9A89_013033 [Geosiphon pyriformis]